jgi:hypothetical protein
MGGAGHRRGLLAGGSLAPLLTRRCRLLLRLHQVPTASADADSTAALPVLPASAGADSSTTSACDREWAVPADTGRQGRRWILNVVYVPGKAISAALEPLPAPD